MLRISRSALLLSFVFLALSSQSFLFGQGISTEGKDFWLSYLTNWLQSSNNQVILELYISADDTTSGTVSMPRMQSFTPIEFEVLPNATQKITIPTSMGMASGTNLIENKGIHVETNKNVSVYAMNKRQYSADMTVVLPTYSLGNDYFVLSHWEDGNRNNNANSHSEFMILAVADSTEIEINPSQTTLAGNPASVPFRVVLQKGQTYQVQAQGDLTGTQISATNKGGCQNFAVFSGNMYTQVGECNVTNGHDHLFAQMYPTSTLGKEFIVVPLENRYGGDIVKILATEDHTTVTAFESEFILNAGEFVKVLSDKVLQIKSDKPIAVGQYSRTMGCDDTLGDPFLIPISPNEQLLNKITFNAPSIATLSRYSLNIIAPVSSVPDLTFDGTKIGSSFKEIPGSEYAYAQINTTGGNHTIRSDDGFIAYVYGFGRNESFGYATGASLGNLNIDLTINDQNPDTPIDSLCLGSVLSFTPVTDTIFNFFEYDFGDGTNIFSDQDTTVHHTYKTAGEYIVSFKASTGADDCSKGNEETSIKRIRVIEPEVEILGPKSVCPNTSDVPYFVTQNVQQQLSWFANGGSIGEIREDSILVDWYGTNNQAGIQIIATNRYGCASDTIPYPVKINVQLDPEAPFGPDTLCSDNIINVPYYAYFTNASTYEWQTDFGTINSDGSSKTAIDWNSYGMGNIWFDQISITDTVCDGTSDTLSVYIQRNPSVIGQIVTEKDTFQLGEEIQYSLHVDSLYQFADWHFDDGTAMDTLLAKTQLTHTFQCDGWHLITAAAYDTGTVCSQTIAQVDKQILVLSPSIEIINVTSNEAGDALEINLKTKNTDFYQKNFFLYRRVAGSNNWILVQTFTSNETKIIDKDVDINTYTYEYKVETNADCPNSISTVVHQSILVQTEQNEHEGEIFWTDYVGWQSGVDQYEVWVSIDSGEYTLLEKTAQSQFHYADKNSGFDHCFRIIARERDGNEATSLSNSSCVSFVPEIKTYNVITPNSIDQINEYFTIDNIEHYKNSKLVIMNRHGKVMLETTGYNNDWNGQVNGRRLPSGTYFFELELNEPRNEIARIRGYFSILY